MSWNWEDEYYTSHAEPIDGELNEIIEHAIELFRNAKAPYIVIIYNKNKVPIIKMEKYRQ